MASNTEMRRMIQDCQSIVQHTNRVAAAIVEETLSEQLSTPLGY